MTRNNYLSLVLLLSGAFSFREKLFAHDNRGYNLQKNEMTVNSEVNKPGKEQKESFGSKAFCFVENKGQVTDQFGKSREDIQFKLSDAGVNVFIGNGALHYQWASNAESGKANEISMYRMDMVLAGANKNAKIVKVGKQAYHERFVWENKTERYAAGYEKVVYQNVYPNIDWQLYLKDGNLEYDFVVHPGGNVADIRLQYDGATSLEKQANGGIRIVTPMGHVTEQTPYSFATTGQSGNTEKVASAFVLNGNTVSFVTGKYEGTLTIDPVLQWATYYGGAGTENAYSVVTDKAGNVYMTGYTNSTTNIATAGAYRTFWLSGNLDAYLVKFNSAGVRLWGTYFGGFASDIGNGVTCDKWGNVYVVGNTTSASGFATAGSHQFTFGGGSGTDAFLTKFDSTGVLEWTTYYGGTGTEYGYSVTADESGFVYMAGVTSSDTSIATPGAYRTTLVASNAYDAFIAKFDTAGVRQWGSYYGGPGYDEGRSLALDPAGNIYLGGSTQSASGISTANAFQPVYGGGVYGGDAYLAKFSNDGTTLKWATYFGGAGNDGGKFIAYGRGNIYLAGTTDVAGTNTSSTGLATTGSHQPVKSGASDAFLVKFDTTGARLWSTYYGGSGYDQAGAVLFDGVSNVYLLGQTKTPSGTAIATPGTFKDTLTGSISWFDAFLVKFNDQGVRQWGTYYGGTNEDNGNGLAYDKATGSLYFCGVTSSTGGIATPGSFQDTQSPVGNNQDGYLAKFFECPSIIKPDTIVGMKATCPHNTLVYSIPPALGATSYTWTLPNGWTGASDSTSIAVVAGQSAGFITVKANNLCDTSMADSIFVNVYMFAPAVITVNGFELGTASSYTTYQWMLNGNVIPGATNATYTVIQNGNYTVAVTSTDGCADTSVAYLVTNVGVAQVQSVAQQITVYPNPASNTVHIHSPVKVNVAVTDVTGKVIRQLTDIQSISVKDLADGIYLLRITDANGVLYKVEKLIKQDK